MELNTDSVLGVEGIKQWEALQWEKLGPAQKKIEEWKECDLHIPTINKGPYLHYPRNDGIAIIWRLDMNFETSIKWGDTPECTIGEDAVRPYTRFLQYKFFIGELIPNARYYYRLAVNGTTSLYSFVYTPPSAE